MCCHSSLRHAIISVQIEKLRDRRSSLEEVVTYSILIGYTVGMSEFNALCNRGKSCKSSAELTCLLCRDAADLSREKIAKQSSAS